MSGIIDSDDQVFFAECLGPTSLPSITISFNDVDWEGLLRAEGGGRTAQATSLIDMKDGSCHNLSHVLLTEDDVQRIKIADMQVLDFVSGDVEDARAYTAALLKLLYLSTSDSSVQLFAVSRIQAILSDQEGETAGLFENQEGTAVDPAPFLRAIRGGDAKVQAVASISLALICAHTGCTTAAGGLVDWICSEIEEGRACNSSVRATVTALTVLLRQRGARLMFIAKGGVTLLNSMLRMQGGDAANMQLLYELCFCLWCLSFEEDALSDFSGCCAVATLSQQVSASLREKIVRVSLSALCRLTYSALIICFCRDMIACGLLNTLEKFKSRPWSDPDIVADAEELRILLLKNHREITTFECYSQEVMSGQLKWGVLHTERFWRETAREMDTDNFFIIKRLIELVDSEDEAVVAIACYDLGEFARWYSNGKAIIKHLGGKDAVMKLCESPNKEINHHALLCISKILVQHWEFIR